MNSLRKLIGCAISVALAAPVFAKEMKCIPAPINTSKDVKAEIAAKVEGLKGVVNSGNFSAQLGVFTTDLYSKYPNADRLITAQLLLSQVCNALNSWSITDQAKMTKYSETEKLVFQIAMAPPTPSASAAKK